MEVPLHEAESQLANLISMANRGMRVVITRDGAPIAEIKSCAIRGGIDFELLEQTRRRLGIEDRDGFPEGWDDPIFSPEFLGTDEECP